MRFWVLHDGVSVLDADGIVEPPHGPGAAPEVSELPVTVQVDRVPDDVVADIGLVDVGADDKGIVSFGKPAGKLLAQPVCFLRGNFSGFE